MFNFVQSWLAPASRPIGVDFGTDCLRMAQVQFDHGEPRLIAAASADVPPGLGGDTAGRAKFFVGAVRDLLAGGNFRGRQILLALPTAMTLTVSVTISSAEQAQAKAKITTTLKEKLGIEEPDILIRELVVGGTTDEPGLSQDAVVIAASRAQINRLIEAATEARLQIVGMNVEPRATVDCFSHVYRRRSDQLSTSCFVDIGVCGTRLTVARAGKILGARAIAMGSADFTRAVAKAASISIEEAKLQRIKICHADTQLEEHRDKRELYVVRTVGISADIEQQRKVVDHACGDLSRSLIRQIEQFRSRISQRLPSDPIDRLVFIGGEAHNRVLCRSIARAMQLSALVGDPLLRMRRQSEVGFESGIDRREPQPAWVVAIGLSLGPARGEGIDEGNELPLPAHTRRPVHLMENAR